MKSILILFDSLNRHFLNIYGCEKVKSPNIASFADDSVVFDNHWLGSAPCMPARRDIMTGRLEFLERGWGPIEPFDIPLPEKLRENGIFTHIITDHYHYLEKGGENYLTSFDTWEMIRGQEDDPWVSRVERPQIPEHLGAYRPNYYLNKKRFRTEEDFPGPKTFRSAISWLRENKGADNFFLWIEAFDPHEPFDCPNKYLNMYEDGWEGPLYFWSGYEEVEEDSEATRHLRRQYAATLTMIDHWFGKFLEEIRRQGLLDDTLIVLTSDHGHLLGEHGLTGKNFMPVYPQLAHIPCVVHLPQNRMAGHRIDALTQNIDIYPTVLTHFGVEIPERVQGVPWQPLLEGKRNSLREAALFGYFGKSVNITDGRYEFIKSAVSKSNSPLYLYSAMPVAFRSYWPERKFPLIETGRYLSYTRMPIFKLPINVEGTEDMETGLMLIDDQRGKYNKEDMLIDLETGEIMKKFRREELRELKENYTSKLIQAMEEHGAPAEQYTRLGLRKEKNED